MFFIRCAKVWHMPTKGVLHRDSSLKNVMLGEFGEVLVVDWGIAKILNQYVPADTEEAFKPTTLSLSRSSLKRHGGRN